MPLIPGCCDLRATGSGGLVCGPAACPCSRSRLAASCAVQTAATAVDRPTTPPHRLESAQLSHNRGSQPARCAAARAQVLCARVSWRALARLGWKRLTADCTRCLASAGSALRARSGRLNLAGNTRCLRAGGLRFEHATRRAPLRVGRTTLRRFLFWLGSHPQSPPMSAGGTRLAHSPMRPAGPLRRGPDGAAPCRSGSAIASFCFADRGRCRTTLIRHLAADDVARTTRQMNLYGRLAHAGGMSGAQTARDVPVLELMRAVHCARIQAINLRFWPLEHIIWLADRLSTQPIAGRRRPIETPANALGRPPVRKNRRRVPWGG